ncbi:hypothetical protein AG0111_0g9641 [Alternaria gaisen]|uniref:Uncharacterized protein n=1 Tax=Alternaria gaisen TaxID=167740 RepID=A0ACB6FBQ8_9PLEO|nr:hypothetical protein AG0111_0g9641 [Alternaria gaisen]
MLELETTDTPGAEHDRRLLPCLEFCVDHIPASSGVFYGVKVQIRKWPPGLSFSDTCESVALFPARINQYLTYWDDGGPVQQPPTQKEGVMFREVEGWENIYVVRISLQFLATMVEFPVDICAHAKNESPISGLPTGYPRICYAADYFEQPGSAESSFPQVQDNTTSTVRKRKARAANVKDEWMQQDAIKAVSKRRRPFIE